MEYKTIEKSGIDEFIEKRSRFIGYSKPVKTEQEAVDFINEIRSKHWDATHNVYAYILREGQIMRYSDDGEPQGTAGMPVLDVLKKSQITDTVVVVTRYFGGALLGTGGLVRAYSHGAKIAVDAGHVITMKECVMCSLLCSYTQYGKLASLVPSNEGIVDDTIYTDNVELKFHIAPENIPKLNKQLADITAGTVSVIEGDKKFYALN